MDLVQEARKLLHEIAEEFEGFLGGHHPKVFLKIEVRNSHHHSVTVDRRFLKSGANHMSAVSVTVGHTVTCSIVYLDQNGNPMLTAQTPDAAPAWAQTTPATETMAVSADGKTNMLTAVTAGSDSVSVALAVGGIAFSASIDITVVATPQVLTSIGIATTIG